MKGNRLILKRPKIHYLIVAGYIIAPIANIVIAVVLSDARITDLFDRFYRGYGLLAGIWLITAPFIGIGLLYVHRVSWFIFIAHSVLMLADYFAKWIRIPGYAWISVGEPYQILLLSGNIVIVLVIVYIVGRDFRAPYFQVFPHGWRVSKRYPIRHVVTLADARYDITDLSATGCFVAARGIAPELPPGFLVELEADPVQIRCSGEIMRRVPEGWGVCFRDIGRRERRAITHLIRTRFAYRYSVEMQASWDSQGRVRPASVLDVSRTGCYLSADIDGIEVQQTGLVVLLPARRNATFAGEIVWTNPAGRHDRPVGFGVRFTRRQRTLPRLLVPQSSRLRLRDRSNPTFTDAKPAPSASGKDNIP
jgi:hypothetical protein